jgi:hypothetical protein
MDSSLLVMPREDFQKFYKGIPQLRLNFDLALRSRYLARKLQFNWLRPDEVIYFLARKHPIVLYLRLIWPLLDSCATLLLCLVYDCLLDRCDSRFLS